MERLREQVARSPSKELAPRGVMNIKRLMDLGCYPAPSSQGTAGSRQRTRTNAPHAQGRAKPRQDHRCGPKAG